MDEAAETAALAEMDADALDGTDMGAAQTGPTPAQLSAHAKKLKEEKQSPSAGGAVRAVCVLAARRG